jgi:hypothetical protein
MGSEVNTEVGVAEKGQTESLRYLDASAVEYPAGKLEGVALLSQDEQTLGTIDGVLIDPATRTLRYFVVDADKLFRRRKYLVPADNSAVVMQSGRALRVEVPSTTIERQRFDARTVASFSDEDLVTAMFATARTA